MSLHRAIGATVVTCNVNPCTTEPFRSASDKSVINIQLEAAGWAIIPGRNKSTPTTHKCPLHARF